MFIVASFSIVGGLKASMERLEGNFESELFLVTRPGDSGPTLFDPSALISVIPDCAYGSFAEVMINATPASATVFFVDDERGHILQPLPVLKGNEVREPLGVSYPGFITMTSDASSEQVRVTSSFSLPQFPDAWLLGSASLLANLTGEEGRANFAVAGAISDEQRGHLASEGFKVQTMTGILDFLGQSVEQIQDDIVLVLLPSAFVIAVLSYGFIGSETADKRHDIGILKTIGAGRRRILSYLLSDALLLSLWGGALGVAFGIILSYALSTAASTVFVSVFTMKVDILVLGLAYLATLTAGLAGALIPSLRMTVSPPVRDLREASP